MCCSLRRQRRPQEALARLLGRLDEQLLDVPAVGDDRRAGQDGADGVAVVRRHVHRDDPHPVEVGQPAQLRLHCRPLGVAANRQHPVALRHGDHYQTALAVVAGDADCGSAEMNLVEAEHRRRARAARRLEGIDVRLDEAGDAARRQPGLGSQLGGRDREGAGFDVGDQAPRHAAASGEDVGHVRAGRSTGHAAVAVVGHVQPHRPAVPGFIGDRERAYVMSVQAAAVAGRHGGDAGGGEPGQGEVVGYGGDRRGRRPKCPMSNAAVSATDLAFFSAVALPADDLLTRLRAHAEHLLGAAAEETLAAPPETLRAYVLESGATCAVATVRRHVVSVTHLHRAAGLPDPAKTEPVRLALRTLAWATGTRQRQASALTETGVAAILATTRATTLLALRARALLLVARDLLARRGELVALRVDDLARGADGSATVLIRRSKTDQEGTGAIAWLSPRAVRALDAWLSAAGVAEGLLFRSLRGGRVGGPLPARDVACRLKLMAGLDAARVSGHSARVGMAQDMVASGAELPAGIQAGRWATPAMPARYAERLLAGP